MPEENKPSPPEEPSSSVDWKYLFAFGQLPAAGDRALTVTDSVGYELVLMKFTHARLLTLFAAWGVRVTLEDIVNALRGSPVQEGGAGYRWYEGPVAERAESKNNTIRIAAKVIPSENGALIGLVKDIVPTW